MVSYTHYLLVCQGEGGQVYINLNNDGANGLSRGFVWFVLGPNSGAIKAFRALLDLYRR